MSSCGLTPLEIDSITSLLPTIDSQSSLPNVFGCMMQSNRLSLPTVVKDKCPRPEPTYNNNYNPNEPPRDDRPKDYSPYVQGEPLYDDRPVVIANLPSRHTVAGPPKRLRTQWVWHLGYTFNNNLKARIT
jgi:hypothetical protein